MPAMKIECPHCGRVGATSREIAIGSNIRCPGCSERFEYQGEPAPIPEWQPEEFRLNDPQPEHKPIKITTPNLIAAVLLVVTLISTGAWFALSNFREKPAINESKILRAKNINEELAKIELSVKERNDNALKDGDAATFMAMIEFGEAVPNDHPLANAFRSLLILVKLRYKSDDVDLISIATTERRRQVERSGRLATSIQILEGSIMYASSKNKDVRFSDYLNEYVAARETLDHNAAIEKIRQP